MRMHNKTLKTKRALSPPLSPRAGGAALRPPLHLPPYGGGRNAGDRFVTLMPHFYLGILYHGSLYLSDWRWRGGTAHVSNHTPVLL